MTEHRARVEYFVLMSGDCTEDESAEIKRLLDTSTEAERDALAGVWPAEYYEWCNDVDNGDRQSEHQQVIIV